MPYGTRCGATLPVLSGVCAVLVHGRARLCASICKVRVCELRRGCFLTRCSHIAVSLHLPAVAAEPETPAPTGANGPARAAQIESRPSR